MIVAVSCQLLKYHVYCCSVMSIVLLYYVYYCSIVCMGGDGTASKLMNGLLCKVQKENGLDPCQPGFTPVPAPVPLGIIPCGKTCIIDSSVVFTFRATGYGYKPVPVSVTEFL